MSRNIRRTAKARLLSALTSAVIVLAALAPFASGGGAAHAAPSYVPPEEPTGYDGALTWKDYTPLGSPTQPWPFLMDLDAEDNVYVTKLMPAGNSPRGIVEKISNDGQETVDITDGTDADLKYPAGIAVDSSGNVYVADNSKIYPMLSVVVGDPTGNQARILKFTPGATPGSYVLAGDIAKDAGIAGVIGIAVDAEGNVYAVDNFPAGAAPSGYKPKIWKWSRAGNEWDDDLAGSSSAIENPFDIAVDGEGNVFVSDYPTGSESATQIFKLKANGDTWDEITPSVPFVALGLAVDPFDHVLLANFVDGSVSKLKPGVDSAAAPANWSVIQMTVNKMGLFDIAADRSGFVYAIDYGSGNFNIVRMMATVTYNANGGGTAPKDDKGYKPGEAATILGPGALSKPGEIFGGWNTESGGTGTTYAPGDTISMTRSITLYAVWLPPSTTFTVNYDAGTAGTLSGGASEEVAAGGSPASVPTVMPNAGYTFLGWSSDGGTTLLSNDELAAAAIYGNKTFTAYYSYQAPTVTGLELDSGSYSLSIGQTHQTVVTAVYSDNGKQPISAGVTFSSSHPAIASVSETGLVTAIAGGNTVITAVYGSHQAQAAVTVLPGAAEDPSEEPEDPSEPEDSPSPSGPANGTGTAKAGVKIIVDGVEQEQLATAEQETIDGQTATKIVLDSRKIIDKLARENNKRITIPVSGNSQVVVGQLTGDLVKAMESSAAEIRIVTDRAAYTLPAALLDIDGISAQAGPDAKLEDMTIEIRIHEPSEARAAQVQAAAEREGGRVVAHPVEFEIIASYGSKTVQVNRFGSYVERMITLPEGTDPSDITTGVVLTEDGELFHVPTIVIRQDGVAYAVMNSLTNSTYSVIYHPREMADVSGHWARADVNDMASRLIVEGVSAMEFRPDAAVTRAEFAAIVTRGLGIRPAAYAGAFPDVRASDWYAGAVQAAAAHGLISGYGDGAFRPEQRISRQEAAAVLRRASEIAKLKASAISDAAADRRLSAFADGGEVAGWARADVAAAVELGLMVGRGDRLDVSANLTRAETAALVRRLLQAAGLIDA